ncbi:MFS general substrate transporter [Lentithecium fluviatile CBS 122367]|uniref:MFS general substrate transporter n=1 Tax=Lentithecium fluviatile CBS 122367 TaxID=1168545 RepID=A0A6G1J778_9PLEO|nr:MFS general substrate transporter [Lentithecium fluviatile CBS 122367]
MPPLVDFAPLNQGKVETLNHLHGVPLILTLVALSCAVFCVALDITIIATAIPRITDGFHALQDIGWYGSVYLLTQCALELPFGKIYRLFNPKWVFMSSLFFFEVGSALCGAAPSSVALIIGRAIAGVGGAGLFCGSIVIIAHTVPIHKRPLYQSVYGAMFGIASVVGPLIGGAFTDHLTWRWCFYVNLPVGAVTAVIILFYLHLQTTSAGQKDRTVWQLFLSLDPLGLLLFVPAIFGAEPIWASSLFIFCLSSAFFLLVYFLPIYFQAIHNLSPSASGVASIPLILSNVVSIAVTGGLITKFGFYVPYVYLCIVLTCIGCGLITTLDVHTGTAKWIGYQLLYGFGAGCALQIPNMATQNVLPLADIPAGLATIILAQNFGPAVMLSAGNNILNQKLVAYIGDLGIAGIDPMVVLQAGATGFRGVVPEGELGRMLEAYNHALRQTFYLTLAMSCAAVVGGVCIEWKTVRKPEAKKDQGIGEKMNL